MRLLILSAAIMMVAPSVVLAQTFGLPDMPPAKRVKTFRVDAQGALLLEDSGHSDEFTLDRVARLIDQLQQAKPKSAGSASVIATAAESPNLPPSCNDEAIKTTLLMRHFLNPKVQVLDNFLIAGLIISPENQNIQGWRSSWQGRIENIRQDSFDAESNTRKCEADMPAEGGPDDTPTRSAILAKVGFPLCANRTIIYRLQRTEDSGRVYITSRCGEHLAE